jgi:hypothetical protein
MKCAVFVKKWVSDHQTCLHPMKNHEMNTIGGLKIDEVVESKSEEEESDEEE